MTEPEHAKIWVLKRGQRAQPQQPGERPPTASLWRRLSVID